MELSLKGWEASLNPQGHHVYLSSARFPFLWDRDRSFFVAFAFVSFENSEGAASPHPPNKASKSQTETRATGVRGFGVSGFGPHTKSKKRTQKHLLLFLVPTGRTGGLGGSKRLPSQKATTTTTKQQQQQKQQTRTQTRYSFLLRGPSMAWFSPPTPRFQVFSTVTADKKPNAAISFVSRGAKG